MTSGGGAADLNEQLQTKIIPHMNKSMASGRLAFDQFPLYMSGVG